MKNWVFLPMKNRVFLHVLVDRGSYSFTRLLEVIWAFIEGVAVHPESLTIAVGFFCCPRVCG